MPKGLLHEVAQYCWSHDFLSMPHSALFDTRNNCTITLAAVFTNFFRDHAEAFIDAPPYVEAGEHDLRYYSLFQKYLRVYEVAIISCSGLKSDSFSVLIAVMCRIR